MCNNGNIMKSINNERLENIGVRKRAAMSRKILLLMSFFSVDSMIIRNSVTSNSACDKDVILVSRFV